MGKTEIKDYASQRKEYLSELGHEDISVDELAEHFGVSRLCIILCQEFYGWFSLNWDLRDKNEYRMDESLVKDMEARLNAELKAAVVAAFESEGIEPIKYDSGK